MQNITPAHSVRDFVRTLPDAAHMHPMMLRAGKGHVISLPLDLTAPCSTSNRQEALRPINPITPWR